MHRLIRENLEDVLQGTRTDHAAARHLTECRECREEVSAMRKQGQLLASWRDRTEMEPRPGFYARVMDRVEAQGPGSIWSLFGDSAFSRALAVASLALAMLVGVYLVSVEPVENSIYVVTDRPGEVLNVLEASGVVGLADSVPSEQFVAMHDSPGLYSTGATPDPDSVLVNLVTYREQ